MQCRTLGRLAACAVLLAAQPMSARATDGPFETVNRRIHCFNQGIRAKALAPLAEFYLSITSAEVRRGVTNVLANLREPITALSGLAAGDIGLAANAAARFGINSTLGLAGIHERAAAMGYPRHPFGVADAICRWGVPSGPFVVLPLLGPSTVRDAGALAATSTVLSQTLGSDVYLAWSGSDAFIDYVQLHPELESIDAVSLDAYAVYRSAYLQRRAAVCPTDRAGDLTGEEGGSEPP
jgi:phospholipid-binding lipoprotein MlaA